MSRMWSCAQPVSASVGSGQPVVIPRRWDRLGHRGSRAGLGLGGWGRQVRNGGISGSGRASTASIARWFWCSAAGRSGIGSSRGRSPRARAVGIRRWSDVLGRGRIRCGSRHECALAPGRRTSVVRARRRARGSAGHAAMIAAENFTGYAGASCSGFGSVVPNASAGVAQLSTRRGRWLSLAAMTLSSSWVNVDRSAFLCRYWRSSRLMFSLVPRCHGSK